MKKKAGLEEAELEGGRVAGQLRYGSIPDRPGPGKRRHLPALLPGQARRRHAEGLRNLPPRRAAGA